LAAVIALMQVSQVAPVRVTPPRLAQVESDLLWAQQTLANLRVQTRLIQSSAPSVAQIDQDRKDGATLDRLQKDKVATSEILKYKKMMIDDERYAVRSSCSGPANAFHAQVKCNSADGDLYDLAEKNQDYDNTSKQLDQLIARYKIVMAKHQAASESAKRALEVNQQGLSLLRDKVEVMAGQLTNICTPASAPVSCGKYKPLWFSPGNKDVLVILETLDLDHPRAS
jgi:hypothetical protein